MHTLWQDWMLDQLPGDEANQTDSFPQQQESVFQCSLCWAPLLGLSLAMLGYARPDFVHILPAMIYTTQPSTQSHSHTSFSVHDSCKEYVLILYFLSVCECCLCCQTTGFQCIKLWLWAAVAGWPAEAVCWVGQCSGCCDLRLPQPVAGQISGNPDCGGAQLRYGEKKIVPNAEYHV